MPYRRLFSVLNAANYGSNLLVAATDQQMVTGMVFCHRGKGVRRNILKKQVSAWAHAKRTYLLPTRSVIAPCAKGRESRPGELEKDGGTVLKIIEMLLRNQYRRYGIGILVAAIACGNRDNII